MKHERRTMSLLSSVLGSVVEGMEEAMRLPPKRREAAFRELVARVERAKRIVDLSQEPDGHRHIFVGPGAER